jgi:predicted RNA binding protein YcfA (HicA-like mRNA interferase family)
MKCVSEMPRNTPAGGHIRAAGKLKTCKNAKLGSEMTKSEKILDRVLRGNKAISFRDMQLLLSALGFHLDRISHSHHIYVHKAVSRPLSVQPVGKDTKPYQLRQLRAMIAEFELKLDR